jgi:hypothetical protein
VVQRGRAAIKTSLSVSSVPQEISHRAHGAAQWTPCEIFSCRRGHGENPCGIIRNQELVLKFDVAAALSVSRRTIWSVS